MRTDAAAQGTRSLLPLCPDIFGMAALPLVFCFLVRNKGEQMTNVVQHQSLPFPQESVASLASLFSDFPYVSLVRIGSRGHPNCKGIWEMQVVVLHVAVPKNEGRGGEGKVDIG